MTPEESLHTVRATLARFGMAETLLVDASKTVERRPSSTGETGSLPRITLGQSSSQGSEDLVVCGELGRGGMGVVHRVEQRSLSREVAVKTVHGADDAVMRSLVREARMMGSLEHPNLVPVHALGVDDRGQPVLVMKRIEGECWRDLLADRAHPAWASLLAGHGAALGDHDRYPRHDGVSRSVLASHRHRGRTHTHRRVRSRGQ